MTDGLVLISFNPEFEMIPEAARDMPQNPSKTVILGSWLALVDANVEFGVDRRGSQVNRGAHQ